MASSPPHSRLTALQSALLESFFAHDRRTFLTGGAALAGFYLGHRTTDDLVLFTLPEADLDDIERAFVASAQSLGGVVVERVQSYPDFRRLLVTRGDEVCKIDLVLD